MFYLPIGQWGSQWREQVTLCTLSDHVQGLWSGDELCTLFWCWSLFRITSRW